MYVNIEMPVRHEDTFVREGNGWRAMEKQDQPLYGHQVRDGFLWLVLRFEESSCCKSTLDEPCWFKLTSR